MLLGAVPMPFCAVRYRAMPAQTAHHVVLARHLGI
jgi:hypothetical protein